MNIKEKIKQIKDEHEQDVSLHPADIIELFEYIELLERTNDKMQKDVEFWYKKFNKCLEACSE
jgi:hypothetical protein